jgi:hypothetical protein
VMHRQMHNSCCWQQHTEQHSSTSVQCTCVHCCIHHWQLLPACCNSSCCFMQRTQFCAYQSSGEAGARSCCGFVALIDILAVEWLWQQHCSAELIETYGCVISCVDCTNVVMVSQLNKRFGVVKSESHSFTVPASRGVTCTHAHVVESLDSMTAGAASGVPGNQCKKKSTAKVRPHCSRPHFMVGRLVQLTTESCLSGGGFLDRPESAARSTASQHHHQITAFHMRKFTSAGLLSRQPFCYLAAKVNQTSGTW